ncbi:MAG: ribosomal-processing cysteine protease Prp [Treponema sp.]|nr:ribosomal-processing cysteine protease Prp [Treponema sp.]
MTQVFLACSGDGSFQELRASGHADFAKKGHDIVCAAESFLLRTAVQVLESDGSGLVLETDAPRRGELSFRVASPGTASRERLVCVADFIRNGMQSLSDEYPGCVSFREETGFGD